MKDEFLAGLSIGAGVASAVWLSILMLGVAL